MPTWDELQAQMVKEGVANPAQRNQRIASLVKNKQLTQGPELTDEEVAQKWEPVEPELTDEEVRQRLTPLPEEKPSFEGIVKRMAENYQTSTQYRQLLDQELAQISAQIAELTQRRNMIEMARRGQG
jgi:hypothetical protein